MKKWLPTQLIALLVVFVALAIFYSVIIPIFEGPDEDDHFRYARFIAEQRTLPIQLFQPGGGVAGHQGWQPPLYYALAALVIAPIDTSDYEQHLWRNPAATFVGDPACCGRNIYYHTDSENFPFTRTTLAVHLARLLSILFGAITVAATYALARTAIETSGEQRRTIAPTTAPSLPSQADSEPTKVGFAQWLLRLESPDLLALAAASFVAFNPSFLFSSALVSNDTALAAFSALALLMWVQFLAGKRPLTLKNAAWLGAIIGLALLTKTTALGLIPFSVLALCVAAWKKRDWKLAIGGDALMLAVTALLAGWWFVRNLSLYGDPLALRLMSVSALFPRAGPLTLAELFQISLPWLWQTFWGGPTPGDFSPAILIALAVLATLALVGLVLYVLRFTHPCPERSRRDASRIPFAFLAAWLAFILVAQIQFIQTTVGADQGRYLFPAISAIALFFVVGLRESFDRFTTRITTLLQELDWNRQGAKNAKFYFDFLRVLRVFAVKMGFFQGRRITYHVSRICHLSLAHWLIGSFFALALFVPLAYTLPAYARPALAAAEDLARITHPTQITFADQMQLLGYDLDAQSVKPGDTLRVTLYWRALAPMNESYRVFVHLIGVENRSAGGADVIPARGAFPTVYWKPGDTLRDVVQIPVTANAMPGKYAIEVGLYPVGKPGERLSISQSDEDRAVIGAIKVAPRQAPVYAPQTRADVNFGNAVRLIGYDARRDASGIGLVLYWQASAPLDRDYTVFAHALDDDGKIIAQVDQQPQAGNYPTSIWAVGEPVRDELNLTLPANSSRAKIEIGLYAADSGARLPVIGANGQVAGDKLVIEIP